MGKMVFYLLFLALLPSQTIAEINLIKCRGKIMFSSKFRYPAPKMIKMVDMYSKEIKLELAETVPEGMRFLFLKKGHEVSREEDADEIIPVVEIRRYSFNENWKLVPQNLAINVKIDQIDNSGNILRITKFKTGKK
ncbi:hypothetical protein HZU77_015190 [Neisseriaceae bacterium TC5R-5]|nr:hypothetical protein [Neisseriaceae bacterium TC5R-5]